MDEPGYWIGMATTFRPTHQRSNHWRVPSPPPRRPQKLRIPRLHPVLRRPQDHCPVSVSTFDPSFTASGHWYFQCIGKTVQTIHSKGCCVWGSTSGQQAVLAFLSTGQEMYQQEHPRDLGRGWTHPFRPCQDTPEIPTSNTPYGQLHR